MPATRAEVRVRQAGPDDLDLVVALRLALITEHRDNIIYGRTRRDMHSRAQKLFLAQLKSPREIILLAERAGQVAGILRCVDSAGHPLLYPDRYGYISSVFVRPEARRHGVLRALLGAAESWCRARGLDELRLHNAADNPLSNASWEALGFGIAEHLRIRRLAAEE
ncbi:MAG TPA: GNAT family N-acetyltransferase [Gemmatimonadaceae bacterium]|nr:GNAT family N-acetyltransferase [Gemmatimonadaceae bacterium]